MGGILAARCLVAFPATSLNERPHSSQSPCAKECPSQYLFIQVCADNRADDQSGQRKKTVLSTIPHIFDVAGKGLILHSLAMLNLAFGHFDNAVGRTGADFFVFSEMLWMCNWPREALRHH